MSELITAKESTDDKDPAIDADAPNPSDTASSSAEGSPAAHQVPCAEAAATLPNSHTSIETDSVSEPRFFLYFHISLKLNFFFSRNISFCYRRI